VILGMPDLVLTASGKEVVLKKGSDDKSHQYWELINAGTGMHMKQNKH
jgi:hypothetical protein